MRFGLTKIQLILPAIPRIESRCYHQNSRSLKLQQDRFGLARNSARQRRNQEIFDFRSSRQIAPAIRSIKYEMIEVKAPWKTLRSAGCPLSSRTEHRSRVCAESGPQSVRKTAHGEVWNRLEKQSIRIHVFVVGLESFTGPSRTYWTQFGKLAGWLASWTGCRRTRTFDKRA